MASKKKKVAKAVAFNPTDVANIAKNSPYIRRLLEDADLRDNIQKAIDSGKSAYSRLSNGKAPHRALIEDKKLQKDIQKTYEAVRNASTSLSESGRKSRKGFGFGRKLLVLGVGGGLALAGSEKLRSKVLDTLFGKEEEFQYTPPATSAPTPAPTTTTPVSSA